MGRCGSLWLVVARCGSLWVVLGRFGSFRVLVTTLIRNETFSLACLRKSGFHGSVIVRHGYDRTNIFIANGEPPIWATESYIKESQ